MSFKVRVPPLILLSVQTMGTDSPHKSHSQVTLSLPPALWMTVKISQLNKWLIILPPSLQSEFEFPESIMAKEELFTSPWSLTQASYQKKSFLDNFQLFWVPGPQFHCFTVYTIPDLIGLTVECTK